MLNEKLVFSLKLLKELREKNFYSDYESQILLIDIEELHKRKKVKANYYYEIEFFKMCNFTIIKKNRDILETIKF